MTFKNIIITTLFFIFMGTVTASAQESIIPDLSSDYVQKLIDTAIANYPKVKSYQNRVNIASTNITKTKTSLLEAVTLSYVYQPGVVTINPVSPSTSYFQGLQLGLFVNLGTLLERPSALKTAREELSISKNDQDEYLINLTTEVKKRYYVYIQRVAELKLQTRAVQEAEASLKDIKYKFEKGEETFDSYNKVQGSYTTLQETKIAAEANLFSAKADLEELLGTKLENVR